MDAPISNDAVTLEFRQLVKSNDPLRTGTYSKTLTFTLSHHHAVTALRPAFRARLTLDRAAVSPAQWRSANA